MALIYSMKELYIYIYVKISDKCLDHVVSKFNTSNAGSLPDYQSDVYRQ